VTRCAEATARPCVHVASAPGRCAGRLEGHRSDGDPEVVQSVRGSPQHGPCGLRLLPSEGSNVAAALIGRSIMSEPTTNALPIVLIHGLWMTARSWDRWPPSFTGVEVSGRHAGA
jgi:pimeloyl-ACP methyl ester carboxylesterase